MIKSMNDLFVHTLRDVLSAERQILKALPKMARAAGDESLRAAFESHIDETQEQVSRLEQIFEELDLSKRAIKCEAIEGLIAEAQDLMKEVEDPEVRDAGMLAAAQAVEHYEISRYGTLIAWAEQMGLNGVDLLKRTLEEEKATDRKLSDLAEAQVNRQAAE
jgi:ferritin-like metal-binding protein YciE